MFVCLFIWQRSTQKARAGETKVVPGFGSQEEECLLLQVAAADAGILWCVNTERFQLHFRGEAIVTTAARAIDEVTRTYTHQGVVSA